MTNNVDPFLEQMCREMHDRYEEAASWIGWETQASSRAEWDSVPEANKATMRIAMKPIADHITRLLSRLNISIDTVEGIPTGYGEDEIDRLQTKNTYLQEELSGYVAANDVANTEIERLRELLHEQLSCQGQEVETLNKQIESLKKENDTLRRKHENQS